MSSFLLPPCRAVFSNNGYGDLFVRDVASGDQAVFRHELDGVTFYGFSGTDSCGRRNVAITNEEAGRGEGGGPTAQAARIGQTYCYPIEVQNLRFVETPEHARVRFSSGPEVMYGLCTLQDRDGSLLGGSSLLDEGIGPYFYKSARKHEWPPEYLRDCQNWARGGYQDDYDGNCLWWLRKYDTLHYAISDGSKRGLAEGGMAGTGYTKAACETLDFGAAAGALANNLQLCTGMEYVLVKTNIPSKVVSGSEVLYGPVGYVSIKDSFYGSSLFGGEDTTVDIYRDYPDSRLDQMPPQSGADQSYKPRDKRYPQPFLGQLVNHGYYRVEYTGDIGVFNEGYHEYELVGLTDAPRLKETFAVVLDIKVMKAVTWACYYRGREVKASSRQDAVSLDADACTWYFDPVSRILSFLLKGSDGNPCKFKQIDVVAVAFGVDVGFDDFFADNALDPNAIDGEFSSLVPPSYNANYDPDNGAIIKSNPFVRNLASVLGINPERIRVVNIVPGNRRRLLELQRAHPDSWEEKWESALRLGGRRLEDGGGLGVDFEMAAVDPCSGVFCENDGTCFDGVCACASGFAGPSCNATVVVVNCSLPVSNCTNGTAPTEYWRPQGTESPTAAPTVASTSAAAVGAFAELMGVADALLASASAGTLDTGYDIADVIVAKPEDECGVPGGDSSTCLDACGEVNGDNSTCADACGRPYGDGTSCLVATGGFYDCDHAEPATGILNDRQAVVLRGLAMTGTWRLSFNGVKSKAISVYESEAGIATILGDLSTTGILAVTATQAAAASGAGVSAIDVQVEFTRATSSVPFQLGAMPLLELDTANLVGATYEEVDSVCVGRGRAGHTYEEQRLSVTAAGAADVFVLALNASGDARGAIGTTAPISASATGPDLAAAVVGMAWAGLPDDSSFSLSALNVEAFAVASPAVAGATREWVVRFHFAPNGAGLYMTDLGDVPPLFLAQNASSEGLSLAVAEVVKGAVPASAMPVSAAAAAAAAGSSVVAAVAAAEVAQAEVEPTAAAAVVHLCGDGRRTTIESCDDGGLLSGDGCSANCTVEPGFVCSTQIGQTSACYVPEAPVLYFEAASFGPFDEGTSGTAVVRRMGYNGSAVSATFTAYGSTAFAATAANDVCATAGDFAATTGAVVFAPGQTSAAVGVPLLADGIWEQTLLLHEKLVVALSAPVGATVDDTRSQAFVLIRDLDHANFTEGYCLTDAPSLAPTDGPTHTPTPAPTPAPTVPPTTPPSPLPSLSLAPTAAPTLLPSVTPEPTPGTFEPTGLPTPRPSWPPTTPPTDSPTWRPTALPSASPTPVPTLPPSFLPSAGPTALPTGAPSHFPTPAPTPGPTHLPTTAPTPLWIGLVVKASTTAVLTGFSSAAEFDAAQSLLFRTAIVDSVSLLTDVSQVNVTGVAAAGSRRHRRGLVSVTLEVDYTMTVEAEGATSGADVGVDLATELAAAFDDSGGSAPFAASLAAAATALGTPTAAAVDSAASTAALAAMSVVVTEV